MKICHVTSVHKRYDARILHKECASLAKAGYDVTLLVADTLPSETLHGVRIQPVNFIPKNRFQRIFKAAREMYAAAVLIDADVYHLHDPELLPLGLKLKRKGKKVIFDSHEHYALQIAEKTWIPYIARRMIAFAYSQYETYVMKRIDRVIGVSPGQMAALERIVPDAVMITNYPLIYPQQNACEKNNCIVYAGAINDAWNHMRVLDALQDIDIRYELMGVIEPEYLKQLQNYRNGEKINFLGRLPYDEVMQKLPTYRIGMALYSYKNSVGGKLGSLGNTKLFEYMQAGIPVICTDFTLWKEIVEKWHCGVCVNPYDVPSIRNAIEYVLGNEEVAERMGHNGRKAIETEYNWETQEKKLIELYGEI